MHGGGNRIYGLHVIIPLNGLFAECEGLDNFRGLCGPRTRTCKLIVEDKDFPREDNNDAKSIDPRQFNSYQA